MLSRINGILFYINYITKSIQALLFLDFHRNSCSRPVL